mgnify:CR=1 FL=1
MYCLNINSILISLHSRNIHSRTLTITVIKKGGSTTAEREFSTETNKTFCSLANGVDSHGVNTATSTYSEIRKRLLQLLSTGEEYNIPYLAKVLGVDRANLHKIIKPLIKKGIIEKYRILEARLPNGITIYAHSKEELEAKIKERGFSPSQCRITKSGVSWIRLKCKTLYREAKLLVDLFQKKSVSQTTNTHQHAPPRLKLRFKRVNPFRFQALRLLANVNMMNEEAWRTLNRLFNAYLEDVSHRAVILRRVDVEDSEFLFLPYKTRFSKSGIRRLLARFNDVFDNASRRYRYGIWLNLSVDPSKYSNLIEMRYELQKAWNRLMSFFRRRFGFRPRYIRVIEYCSGRRKDSEDKVGSGLIHYHVLVLGVRRLIPKDYFEARLPNGKVLWASSYEELEARVREYGFDISECKVIEHDVSLTAMLKKWGFGEVNFLYLVVNRNGKWIPKKLLDVEKCKDVRVDGAGLPRNLRDYLRKYVRKALNELDFDEGVPFVDEDEVNTLALYWALNSRFFTYSRDLSSKIPLFVVDSEGEWEFMGSGYVDYPELLPYHTLDPPWEYVIPFTIPPMYTLVEL